MKKGHVPFRQCVGCRVRKDQRSLLRFVHSASGLWEPDPRRRLPGRGAYVCSPECVERVKKNKRYRTLGVVAQTVSGDWPTLATVAAATPTAPAHT